MRQTRPVETLDLDTDDGTMPESRESLEAAIVGHRIIGVSRPPKSSDGFGKCWLEGMVLTLDTGATVLVEGVGDCCAYSSIEAIIHHLPTMDHVITAVETADEYTRWFIVADAGDVLELQVGWSAGNPFYYAYGFSVTVVPASPVNLYKTL